MELMWCVSRVDFERGMYIREYWTSNINRVVWFDRSDEEEIILTLETRSFDSHKQTN